MSVATDVSPCPQKKLCKNNEKKHIRGVNHEKNDYYVLYSDHRVSNLR